MANGFRKRFIFWLDLDKPDQLKLAEDIETLKADRHYSKTIRDGIRLIIDLRAGRTDVLFELFPWMIANPGQPNGHTRMINPAPIDLGPAEAIEEDDTAAFDRLFGNIGM